MFPSFTGNSRRPRNVNLSGQRHSNPFGAHSLSQPTGSAASRAVADAQALRRRRQQEREELKAAHSIQRVWRGHRFRQAVRGNRRHELKALYSPDCALTPEQRAPQALTLLITSFDARIGEYNKLLVLFANDLRTTGEQLIASGRLPLPKLAKLVNITLKVLNAKNTTPETTVSLLTLLVSLAVLYPQTLADSLDSYYKLLAQFYDKNEVLPEHDKQALVKDAVLVPLADDRKRTSEIFTRHAYCTFASGFLPRPLHNFDTLALAIYKQVDTELLSQAIIEVYGTRTEKPTDTQDQLLRLLARFIDLSRHSRTEAQSSSLYLTAVYTLLSLVPGPIRSLLARTDDDEDDVRVSQTSKEEQAYFKEQFQYLVDKGEITSLLKKFTVSQSSSSELEQASLLAGYATALIQIFPDKADDIRMQFYLADLPAEGTLKPSVQFFWDACKSNKSFKRVLKSPRDALKYLVDRRSAEPTSLMLEIKSDWVQQWRTIFLFLELYTFILRLTDDDDFFSALAIPGSVVEEGPHTFSRLRSCALPLDALKSLSIFLKNLAFTLHYNAAAVLGLTSNGPLFSSSSSSTQFDAQKASLLAGTFEVIPGLDLGAFRSTVTTALQMLYERDSRRQFVSAEHWLMTSGFDMDHVLATVVSEDKQLQDIFRNGFNDQPGDVSDSDDEDEELSPFLYRNPSYSRGEQLRKQSDKAKRNRIKSSIGPTLQILHNMPFVFPFEARVKIFRQFVEIDKVQRRGGSSDPDLWRARIRHRPDERGGRDPASLRKHSAEIRRNAVFESALKQFWKLGEGLKEPIQITFIDEYGEQEAGIGGGVTKEFLTNALTQVLSPEEEMFQYNKENATFPNPMRMDQLKHRLRASGEMEGTVEWDSAIEDLKKRYEFIGRMIGKCMYEGILIDFVFAGFFLLKWTLSATSTDASTGYRASVNDLREMDEALYQGMMKLKNYDGVDVADLDIDFTIEDQVSGLHDARVETVTRELFRDGARMRVTNQNRPLYISYVARHRLQTQPHTITRAFLKGLNAIIDPAWLRMFNQTELQRLVGGDSSEIDVADMRRNTVYSGVYEIGDDEEEHPTIKIFWRVVAAMDDKDRRLLLKYATSTPRAPLLGFAQLSPRFSIRFGGSDETRLPSASTCMNLLKLPMYTTEATLREKLIYAIRADVGFGITAGRGGAVLSPKNAQTTSCCYYAAEHHGPASNGRHQLPFQRPEARCRTSLSNNGAGSPVKGGTGLVRSAFRPSDDACTYQLFVPGNVMLAVYLEACANIVRQLGNLDFAKSSTSSSSYTYWNGHRKRGIEEHGRTTHSVFGTVYAYEGDGFGSHNLMDDANIPSLLSAPRIKFVDREDPVYQNTRRFVLSRYNPYYMEGPVINGTGGPHVGIGMAWPMAVIVQILTEDDDEVIYGLLKSRRPGVDARGGG